MSNKSGKRSPPDKTSPEDSKLEADEIHPQDIQRQPRTNVPGPHASHKEPAPGHVNQRGWSNSDISDSKADASNREEDDNDGRNYNNNSNNNKNNDSNINNNSNISPTTHENDTHINNSNDQNHDTDWNSTDSQMASSNQQKDKSPHNTSLVPVEGTPSHHTFRSVQSMGPSNTPFAVNNINNSSNGHIASKNYLNNKESLNNRTISVKGNNSTLKPLNTNDNSRFSSLSKTTSTYDHGNFVDENLLLSSTRIDSTLLRLFSKSRDGNHGNNDITGLGSEDKLLPFLNYSESDLISMDAVLWRVHPMDSVHKGALHQEMPFLEENVRPKELLQRLYMDEVLTHMDYNAIMRTEGQGERAVTRLLIRTLMRRGDKAYEQFVEALRILDYSYALDRLVKAEASLRRTIVEDRRTSLGNRSSLYNGITPAYNQDLFYRPYPISPVLHNGLNSNGHTFSPTVDRPQEAAPSRSAPLGAPDAAPSRSAPTGAPDASPSRSAVVDSQRLEEQLSGLNAELRALHEDVSALKTARSQSLASGRRESHQTAENNKPEEKPQKSSSCAIL